MKRKNQMRRTRTAMMSITMTIRPGRERKHKAWCLYLGTLLVVGAHIGIWNEHRDQKMICTDSWERMRRGHPMMRREQSWND
jgi:hypothetical protein